MHGVAKCDTLKIRALTCFHKISMKKRAVFWYLYRTPLDRLVIVMRFSKTTLGEEKSGVERARIERGGVKRS